MSPLPQSNDTQLHFPHIPKIPGSPHYKLRTKGSRGPSCNLVVPLVKKKNLEYLPADPGLSHTHKRHYDVKVSLTPHANAKCSCACITDSSKKE